MMKLYDVKIVDDIDNSSKCNADSINDLILKNAETINKRLDCSAATIHFILQFLIKTI